MKYPSKHSGASGFSTVELMIVAAISGLVLLGVYRLWKSNSFESTKLQRKIELRNQVALSTKRLNQSITQAGYGLNKVVGLEKSDDIGSDTLIIFTNPGEVKTELASDCTHGHGYLFVQSGSLFYQAKFVAVTNGAIGEIKAIRKVESNRIDIEGTFANDFVVAGSWAMPATREKFYTDQSHQSLIRIINDASPSIIGKNVHNFQVSFRDRNGDQTEVLRQVKFVNYSLTGVYPAKQGALNSIVFSSTSIPRNIL